MHDKMVTELSNGVSHIITFTKQSDAIGSLPPIPAGRLFPKLGSTLTSSSSLQANRHRLCGPHCHCFYVLHLHQLLQEAMASVQSSHRHQMSIQLDRRATFWRTLTMMAGAGCPLTQSSEGGPASVT